MSGIKITDLPLLSRDVINVAQLLRIEYVWIDRLGIFQGDAEDWKVQAPKMGQYYGNAQ